MLMGKDSRTGPLEPKPCIRLGLGLGLGLGYGDRDPLRTSTSRKGTRRGRLKDVTLGIRTPTGIVQLL